jgi:hypothetical protein
MERHRLGNTTGVQRNEAKVEVTLEDRQQQKISNKFSFSSDRRNVAY